VTRFAGGPGESPGFLLWHVTLRWQRAIAEALAPFQLTHVQFVLLACTWWLNEQGQTPNQQEVAAQAGTDVKMTSEVLRRLESRGLITRRSASADARAKSLTVTEPGLSLVRQAIDVVEQADADFLGAHGAELAKVLAHLT
jgi:DNA-binding MarR family transcriptional regulator